MPTIMTNEIDQSWMYCHLMSLGYAVMIVSFF